MAGPFDDLIPSPNVATAKANPFADLIPRKDESLLDKATGAVKAFAQGGLANFGDELKAAVHAAVPGAIEFANRDLFSSAPQPNVVSHADSYGQRYDENLAKIRATEKQFADQHPYLNAGANAAGSVATALTALPAAVTATGPSAIGNVAKLTATGLGLGALQGAGEGEGLTDRAVRAGVGGTIGGALGLAARPVAAVGRSIAESAPGRAVGDYVVSPVANAARSIFSGGAAPTAENAAQTGALERLATALQRAKVSPEDVGGRLGKLGEQAMLADTDPQLLSAATGVKVLPGATRTLVDSETGPLAARDLGAPKRIAAAFEGNEPPPMSFETLKGMEGNKQGTGIRAYGEMRDAGLNMSDEMLAMKNIPAVRDALAQIEQDAAQTGTALDPVDVMHRVKQKLNDTATAAFASGKPINKHDVGQLANQWEAAFWRANPAAQAADTAYAKAAGLPDYFQSGHTLLTRGTSEKAIENSAPGLDYLLKGAEPVQRLAARTGATNAVRETADNTARVRTLARNIVQGEPLQAKIGELYPMQQAADILQRARTEGVFANTSNRLKLGSQTAEKTSDALDTMGNVGVRVTPEGGVVPRMTESVKAFANWVRAPNEAIRDEIGRLTINPNAKDNAKTLELLAQLLQQRANAGRGTAGIAGALGGQAGGF